MKKILIVLAITMSSTLLTQCETMCCDDGRGHCCYTGSRTCPKTDYNAWWY